VNEVICEHAPDHKWIKSAEAQKSGVTGRHMVKPIIIVEHELLSKMLTSAW
jgi:hypothetical protein